MKRHWTALLPLALLMTMLITGCSQPARTDPVSPPAQQPAQSPTTEPSKEPAVEPGKEKPTPSAIFPTDLAPAAVGVFALPEWSAFSQIEPISAPVLGIPQVFTMLNTRLATASTAPEEIDPLEQPAVRMALSGISYYSSKYGLQTDWDAKADTNWAMLQLRDPVPLIKVGAVEIPVRGLVATFGTGDQAIFLHHAESDRWYRVVVQPHAQDDFDAWVEIMKRQYSL